MGNYPGWWHPEGDKLKVYRFSDGPFWELTLKSDSDTAARIFIEPLWEEGEPSAPYGVRYEIRQPLRGFFGGQIIMRDIQLARAFAVYDFPGYQGNEGIYQNFEWDLEKSNGLLEKYLDSSVVPHPLAKNYPAIYKDPDNWARPGAFIRQGRYLNIPGPGTGLIGDPNISIRLKPEIVAAVSKMLHKSPPDFKDHTPFDNYKLPALR